MLLNDGISFNFGILPVPVLERSNLSANARLVLAVLDGFGQYAIFPHLPTIARRCGWAESSTKTVISAMVELVQAGFLEIQGGRGAHAPNHYYLKLPLYCRVPDSDLSERIQAMPFVVNQMGWRPAIPGGGVIPAGHCQLSDGRVVPADDAPALDPAAAAAAGLPATDDGAALAAGLGAHVEAAIAQAVASLGATPAALALGQRLAALVGATCQAHAPGGPAARGFDPNKAQQEAAAAAAARRAELAAAASTEPAALATAAGARRAEMAAAGRFAGNPPAPAAAVVPFEKNFFGPEKADIQPGLFQNDTSTTGAKPSSAAAPAPAAMSASLPRSADNASKVGEHGMKETTKANNEREKNLTPSVHFDIKELDAWKAWPATWEAANPGKGWAWTADNLAAAERITAGAGVERLAGTLAHFAAHPYWSKNRLPLPALAKYLNEHTPSDAAMAAAAAAAARPAAKPICRHAGAAIVDVVTADAIQTTKTCECGHVEVGTFTRQAAVEAVANFKSAFAAEELARMDAAAAAQGQAARVA